jgi:hypothetical protein
MQTIKLIALAAIMAVACAVQAAPPVPGAVFTTDSTCSGVDLNIYGAKSDVYLDGGPSHPGAASLPPGSYYVQVTNPSGSCVLGTSVGSGNETPFVVDAQGNVQCIQLCAVLINGDPTCALDGILDTHCGYNDTSNPGGEYKVWVSNVSTFDNDSTKTDNFKAPPNGVTPPPPPPPPPVATLCVDKFYDANANGVQDASEPLLQGWQYQVFEDDNLIIRAETSHCSVVPPDTFHVFEGTPIETNWIHTTPTQVDVTLAANETRTVTFGNVCLGAGGGLTIGYWSNRNGQREENDSDFTFLNTLCLRNASGTDKDFTQSLSQNKLALNVWLLDATAVNMAYMLSAQLTAMELNVRHNHVQGGAMIYAPCLLAYAPINGLSAAGFISANDLMTLANSLLCADGYTPSGDAHRAEQECVKTALDDANNNRNFAESTPCPFSFTPFIP